MRTEKTDAAAEAINQIALATPKREGQLDRALAWDEKRGIYTGFYIDYDNGRLNLYADLRAAGYDSEDASAFYNAPYHWMLIGQDLSIEYIEGDLYAVPLT